MLPKEHLGLVDYAVIGTSLLIAAIIGIWFRFFGKKQNTTDEFLMAGKDMPKIPVIISTVVTLCSALTLIGNPTEVYRYGLTTIFKPIATCFGTVAAAYIFIPVYFQCGVSTVYEFLEIRFGKKIRYTVSALFVIQMVFYMAISLYGPVLTLSAVTDLSPEISIILIGAVCTFYCMMGGLKAVLWTDVFQAFLMVLFLIILYVQGLSEVGGVQEVFQTASKGQRLNIWNFSPDMTLRYTIWGASFRGLAIGMAYFGTNQVEVQRMLSLNNITRARSSLIWSSLPSLILVSLCYISGLIMYAVYNLCDPVKDGIHTGLKKYDQIIPYYIVTRFRSVPGLTGLCVAGLFSSSLSTISSALNSASTVTVIDFIKPLLSKITEKRVVFIAKLSSLVYGALCIGLTFGLSKTDSLASAGSTLMSIAEGPVLAIFLVAVLTRKVSEKCALVGLFFGLAFTSWIGYGSLFSGYRHPTLPLSTSGCLSQPLSLNILQNSTSICSTSNTTCLSTQLSASISEPFILYKLSYTWISGFGCCVSLLFIFLATLLTGQENAAPASEKCLSPITQLWIKQKSSDKNQNEKNDIVLKEKLIRI